MAEKTTVQNPVNNLAAATTQRIRERLGEAYKTRLTDKERELLEAATQDAVKIALDAASGDPGLETAQKFAAERKQIEAQLLQISAAIEQRLGKVLWQCVADVLEAGVRIVLS